MKLIRLTALPSPLFLQPLLAVIGFIGADRETQHAGTNSGNVRMEPVLALSYTSPSQVWDADSIGYLASALVLIIFSMRSMRTLSQFAIASKVASVAYVSIEALQPILISWHIATHEHPGC